MLFKISKKRTGDGRVGFVDFENGRMGWFAGYHHCECGVRSKVLLSKDELKELEQMTGYPEKKGLGLRAATKLAKHYGL